MESLSSVVDNIAPLIPRIIEGLEKILPQVGEKIKPIIEKLAPYVRRALEALANLAGTALEEILGPYKDKLKNLLLLGLAEGLAALATGGMSLVLTAVYALAKAALQYLEDNWPQIKE